jgi:predicted small metal-binding protein
MTRYYIDCREHPGDIKCTVALSADSEEELLEAALQHGIHVHNFKDTPEVRAELMNAFKEGTPPA